MEAGILAIIIIYGLYVLLVKGVLWKLIVAIFGWFGMFIFLETYIPASKTPCLSLFSWSEVIPAVIVLLAMSYSKSE
jgi:hypothetical protein